MSLLARFKFFIIGIFLGSILVFFFFGDKVKDWIFYYSSSGRVISHITEPRYTLMNNGDTISDYLSVQQLFTELENRKSDLGINLVSYDSLNQMENPIKYIVDNTPKIKDGTIKIHEKNIFYTEKVINKLGLGNLNQLNDSIIFSIIDDLILNSDVEILDRGDCYSYSLKNKYKEEYFEFIFESCNSNVKLIDFK